MNPAPLDEVILDDGSRRRLGNITPPAGLVSAWPVFGQVANAPLVPRAEWKDRCDEIGTGPDVSWLSPVHDQDGIGMCNASATASAMEAARAKQGLPPRRLSAGDLYRRICFNGRDSGSLLEDGIRVAMAEGICTTGVCPYLDWKNDKSGAEAERRENKVLEAFLCPTFDACFSAVLLGFDLVSGIMWYDTYTPRASTGWWLPAPGGGAGGHAVHGYKPTYRQAGGGLEYGIWHKNSWGTAWGSQGRCVFPEASYRGQVGGWWACRLVTDEGGVVPAEAA